MPRGLKRYQQARELHFITFSCYRRQPLLATSPAKRIFEQALERVRCWYGLFVTGYVIMPEHVHLLISEPERSSLAVAIQMLKQITAGSIAHPGQTPFWQARYYDFNVWTAKKRVEKLRYMHRNPVKRGLVEKPEDWPWSSFRHYATGEERLVEIESEWTARRRERMGMPLRVKFTPTLSPKAGEKDGAPRQKSLFWSMVILTCVLTVSVASQTAVGPGSASVPTVAEILTQHQISLGKDALIAALSNGNAEIRYLAAEQLAVEGAKDSVPAIVRALEAEKVPETRVNIAFSLIRMGDERGLYELQQDCNESSMPMYLRLRAVSYLLNSDDESCLQTVLVALQTNSDSGDLTQAMSLIPRFKKLSRDESGNLRALVLKALRDQTPAVRLVASDTIRTLGDRTAIPYLEAAIASEANVDVRAQMERDLQSLEDRR